MSAIHQKVSHSGQNGMWEGLCSSLTAHGNANAEPSAASFQTPACCSSHCNVTTMEDTLCKVEHPEVMRTKLMHHVSDADNGADWRAYSTEGAGCRRRDDWS
ncbi:hypothetical protein K469DRAFT_805809 [Zopfia rhizophila CBS 207.26]|uniref:Uncharacterized protein n=1 Tax=Zopfia rhizophila CBS 207.26 TaxID=1314779 RepID=A0A6A6DEP3_9PEZI|nr:hypothetical protein K469DRAFT_805809 [Zopfia rhizophila CBS 207.26]